MTNRPQRSSNDVNADQVREEGRLHRGSGHRLGKYLPEFVYGGMDGCVTTFAVVAGSAGAGLSTSITLILGFANLIADGFSMSVGNYLSSRSERDRYDRHRNVEQWEVDHIPETERQEIRDIYVAKGFSGPVLEEVVDVITANKERWVNEMMLNELNMTLSDKLPLRSALMTFLAFNLMGLIPLLVYLFEVIVGIDNTWLFPIASGLTAIGFATIGLMKALVNDKSRATSLAETMLLGIAAAALAFMAGSVLERLLA
jgi:VIT1/CCC1 family predicted Fe2+/Mn2+ transporter